MRLIDADKLILYLNDYALQEAPFRGESADVYDAIENCIKAVEEQTTAYDVDKVVKELEEWSFNADVNVGDGTIMNQNLIARDNAIEIVKRGEKDKEGQRCQ